jgi:hypothetical protein
MRKGLNIWEPALTQLVLSLPMMLTDSNLDAFLQFGIGLLRTVKKDDQLLVILRLLTNPIISVGFFILLS